MKRILVIEDNDLEREFYTQVLKNAGYEVSDAPDGKIGMEQYHRQPCVLVITDIFMPEKDGLEVIQELKRDFLDVRIIAMSGEGARLGNSAVEIILQSAKVFGADRTLQKPFSGQVLLNLVAELLR